MKNLTTWILLGVSFCICSPRADATEPASGSGAASATGSGAEPATGSTAAPVIGLSPADGSFGPSLDDLLKAEVAAARFPEEDAVTLFSGVEVRITPDGRVTRRVRTVMRLLTDLAISENGDPRVAYDTTRQALHIHQCRTIPRSGREVSAQPRAFNRVTPERLAVCPDRAGVQEMVMSLLGLERGCLCELDYTVEDRVPFRPWGEGVEELGSKYPVLQCEVVVRAPGGAAWHAQLGTHPDLAQVREETGSGEHRWKIGPLPGYPDEGGIPRWERVPILVYSTCPSWDTLARWVEDRLRGQVGAADSALTNWCDGPMVNHRLPLDDAERLSHLAWLLRERTTACEDDPLTWWLPVRTAARVLDTSCGNLPDRAALGLAALAEWKIDAGIALCPALGHILREVPALGQIDDIWLLTDRSRLSILHGEAAVRPDPGWAEEILDVTRGVAAGGVVGGAAKSAGGVAPRSADDIAAGSSFVALPPRRGTSALFLDLRQMPSDSIQGDAVLRMGGALCDQFDLADIKGFIEGVATRCAPGGTLTGYRVQALGVDTCDVHFALSARALGDSLAFGRSFLLPSVSGMPEDLTGADFYVTARKQPLYLRSRVEEEVRVRLELNDKTRVLILPRAVRLAGGGSSVDLSCRREGKAILLQRRWSVAQREVKPEEYAAFRSVWLQRVGDQVNRVFLEKVSH